LRPNFPPETLHYPGDEAVDSLHVGAFLEGELVGIASVCLADSPNPAWPADWRLRGMAVDPKAQRQGCGRALLAACFAHIAAQGGTRLWCNARTSALPFYQALGFQAEGDAFETPGTGPHYFMWRSIH
jgi:GNAT superfamily N-acetyltransferase